MERSIISKILIVGGGLTGSVIANLIKHEASANVEIWEKENFIGGRFRTFRSKETPYTSVDLGAQYTSATLEFIRSHARFYDELLDQDKLVPLGHKIENFRKLSESKTNFVAPEGTVSLVEHFINKSDAIVCLNHQVEEINMEKDKSQWKVVCSNGNTKNFDAVITTIPVPEVLKIKGDFRSSLQNNNLTMELDQVKYSSRHAMALIYDKPENMLENLPWTMKFFPDDEIICFIAIDNCKRGLKSGNTSVLVHTTTKFTEKYSETEESELQALIQDRCKCLIPNIPHPSVTKCVEWTYSQVVDAYIDSPGCLVVGQHPCFICGGDSFTESNFNGCITSALRVVEELLKCVTISKCNKMHKNTSTGYGDK